MNGYVLARDVDQNLDNIWEFIAGDDIDAADEWVKRLVEAFDKFGQTPGMGHKRMISPSTPFCLAGGLLSHRLSGNLWAD